MEYRRLGKSGLKLSALSFGSWITFNNQLHAESARECLALAYEHGVNFFDNAEVYANGESERLMGEAIHKLGWARDTYCLSSKVFWGGQLPTQKGLHRKHVVEACHAALRRLRVDYLDLYFCHRPDPETPIEETVLTMNQLIQQGKVLYWGTSEWSAADINEAGQIARAHGLIPPSMEQPEYNLFHRERVEREYAPLYDKWGIGTTIWSPLASGILTDKYSHGIPEDSRMNVAGYEWMRERLQSPEGRRKIEKAHELSKVARELEASTAQVAIAWCLKNPNVSTVILGASRPTQLAENLQALEVLARLDDATARKITSLAAS